MADTMARADRYGKSTARLHGRQTVQRALGAASPDSTHKQIQRGFEKAERVAQLLAHAGRTEPIVAHLDRLSEILESGPAQEITQELRCDGKVGRSKDEARDACLIDGCTAQELDLLETRTRREIAQNYRLLGAIRAHRRTHA